MGNGIPVSEPEPEPESEPETPALQAVTSEESDKGFHDIGKTIVSSRLPGVQLRTATDKFGKIWIFAVDFCVALDIQNPSQAVSKLVAKEKDTLYIYIY